MKFKNEIVKAFEIRIVEEKLLWAYSRGYVRGTVHTCIGQEFNSVILSKYLNKNMDWVLSNHRGHGHFLAFNGNASLLFREILGDKDGPSKGIGGSQHIKHENFMTNGIQGGFAPISIGIAESLLGRDSNGICILWIGDGTLGSGQLWESFNLSAVLNLPILVVLEDNKIAQSTPSKLTFAGDLQKRVEGFGLKYFHCDSLDLNNLDRISKLATTYVRNLSGPALVHIESMRLNSHSKGDDNRDIETIKELKSADLISKLLVEKDFSDIYAQVRNNIDIIFNEASNKVEFFETKSKEMQSQYDESILPYLSEEEVILQKDLIYENLKKALETFANLKIFGEDIMEFVGNFDRSYGGAFKVTQDLSTRFDGRIINMPISESAFIGLGIGRALIGNETIIEIMFGDFLALGFDQIINQLSKIPEMYGFDIEIPLIIRTPMGGGFGYGATHSQSLEKHFLGIPNLLVISPSIFNNSRDFIVNLLRARRPILLIESKRNYFEKIPMPIHHKYKVVSKKIAQISLYLHLFEDSVEKDILLVVYGGLTKYAHEIQVELEEILFKRIDLLVLEDLTRGPSAFRENFKDYRYIFSIEEGIGNFGIGSEIAAISIENGFTGTFLRITGQGIIGTTKLSEDFAIPNKDRIKEQILLNLEKKG